ncbi:hypothetical protein [Streptomyces olivochromogenes]|uniref:hypothetical protein n=1 Tax=Streptomyces olivochromogenes TaxID=1963 RepID=UPI00367CF87D
MTTTPRKLSPRSQAALDAFLARLTELDATLLEPEWLGSGKPHRVRCAQGHDCTPRPNTVQQGGGICRTCAGNDPKVAEAAFRGRLAELGATLLEPKWLGADSPHRVRCAQGHEGRPRPSDVRRGDGVCRACAGRDPKAAEAAFRARLAEVGATLLESQWLGTRKPHRIRCAKGHEGAPHPSSVLRGLGVCRTCARQDPKTAEAAFRARLDELDATLLEERWLGTNSPHRVRCAEGHECSPRPAGVHQGEGICRVCAGRIWDVLYVVSDEWGELVKVGITSGDPRRRLSNHRTNGLDQVVRLFTGLPDGVARNVERQVLTELEAAGVFPVWGQECFYGPRALNRMLDLIDHHPTIRQASQDEPGQLLPS